jgi:hypothetical protein
MALVKDKIPSLLGSLDLGQDCFRVPFLQRLNLFAFMKQE